MADLAEVNARGLRERERNGGSSERKRVKMNFACCSDFSS